MTELPGQLQLWSDALLAQPGPAKIRSKQRPKQGQFLPKEKDSSRYARLVLASGSPSKINVLQLLGLRFKVDPANIDEDSVSAESPERLVCKLALQKALTVRERHGDSLVLGADTLIVDEVGVIGKPRGAVDAQLILKRLSGSTHKVITGLTLLDQVTDTTVQKLAVTSVTFRNLSSETIGRYISTGEPFGKAGGYALQGIGALLVKSVQGEYSNVLGLPIATFVEALFDMGYELI